MGSIEELNRQRAERHKLLDAEFDERIRRIREACRHEFAWADDFDNIGVTSVWKCKNCGEITWPT